MASLLLGCGTLPVRTLPTEYQTVFVRIVNNSTLEYGAEERMTESLVRQFERDGRLRQVPDWRLADLVLEVNITRYKLEPVTFDDDNRRAGSNLDLAVIAGARSPRTGDWIMPEKEFVESGNFFLSNVPGADREPEILRRVSASIVSELLEGWG